MRLLLDAHTVIWWVDQDSLLSPAAHAALTDPVNELLLSAGTIWEVGIMEDLGATILPVTIEYADVQAKLPLHHRDPFDRLLIAQAIVENVPLVSRDAIFDQYSISRVW